MLADPITQHARRSSLALLLTVVVCLANTGCGQSAAQMPVAIAPRVTVAAPVEQQVVDDYFYEGYTAAVSTVDVRARATGYLSKVYFKDGQDLKQGDRLFVIDPRPYQAELAQAKGELARVEAQVKRINADFARAEKLLPMRTISQEEYDRIAGERAQALADVQAKEALVETANLNLHFCAIESPIDGRISRTLVTEGNLVIANETLLTTIVSIAPIYAYFDVDEPTVLRVQKMIREHELAPRQEVAPIVHLGLDIDSGYPYDGTVDFVDNRIDPKTGTLKIRAVFSNQNGALSPGLHARIEMPLGKPHPALMVLERAIASSQGRKYVYVVNEKNEAIERTVQVGLLRGHLREITAGLQTNERIIINGLQRVRDRMVVDPQPGEMTTDEPRSAEPTSASPAAADPAPAAAPVTAPPAATAK
ncbi:MAG: efflux RND transporter periplasmic adaptor subunit [Pirellulales bacterium]